MRIRRASMSVGLGISLMAGVLTSVVTSVTPAQASWAPLPTLATAQPMGFNGQISAAAAGGGRLYLGGDFTQAGRTTGYGAFALTSPSPGQEAVSTSAPQFANGTNVGMVYASTFFDS